MKKVIFIVAAGIVLCATGFISYKVCERQSASPQSILMKQNLDALARGEDWEGWVIGYKMGRRWLISGGGVEGGQNGGGGNLQGEWISCCERSRPTDACDIMSQSMLCQ